MNPIFLVFTAYNPKENIVLLCDALKEEVAGEFFPYLRWLKAYSRSVSL